KHNSYKDRFLNDIKVKSDIVTKAKFEIEDYKNDAHLSNIAKLEQEVANSEIKILNLIISVILLLVFVVSITLYISYTSKMKLSNKLKEQNSELEIAKNTALKSSEMKSKFISNVS